MIPHIARLTVLMSVVLVASAGHGAEPDDVFAVPASHSITALASQHPSAPAASNDEVLDIPTAPQQTAPLKPAGFECLTPMPVSGAPPPSVTLTGFFQVDAAWFAQDSLSELQVGDIPDIVDFRRARLAAKGQAYENVGYMVEFDFAFPGRPNFMDVYLDLQKLPVGTLRAGQWRQPFGMDALTSVKELWFLERALPFAFLPFRQTGVGAFDTALDENLTWAISGYKFPVGPFGGNFGDAGYGLSTRLTFTPLYDETTGEVIHTGLNYSVNDPSTSIVRYRTTPEIGFTLGDFNGVAAAVPFFVDTGPIQTREINLLGAELAAAFGSLTIQSELIYALVAQEAGPSLAFPGAYVQVAYVLTGEHHPYNRRQGVFTRIVPAENFGTRAGCGAWEAAARWSYLDLNDANITGGRLQDLTFGLNWTLNPHTRIQLNYIHAFLGDVLQGDTHTDIVAMRAQLDF